MEERSRQFKRRDMLKLIMLGSGAVLVPGVFGGCGSKTDLSRVYFPNSVASGDPRESSVVLWTRVEDTLQDTDADFDVELEVAKDERFEAVVFSKTLTAYTVFNRCIKIRVDLLEPYSYYFYRFRYNRVYSRTGRTKTAPSAAENRKIRLATVSCQDYPGRYYNTYAHMLQFDDIDAIVHLGDYIYETSGEPTTLLHNENRKVVFRDTEGVITLQEGETTFYAARSIDNYRQLYEIYRSDEMLQQIHERFPMIAVWDDHEYSDDNFGANANYFGGRKNELDLQRKQNSQRAYLEYMPLEVGLDSLGEMSPQSEILLDDSGEAVIYRDFHFGANVHLIMSDYRTYRPDHIIPEDVFPGTVFADKQQLIGFYEQHLGGGEAEYEKNRALLGPYIDVDVPPYDSYKTLLIQVLTVMYASDGVNLIDAAFRASAAIRGKISAFVANEMIKGYNDTVSADARQPLIYQESGDAVYNALEFGLAYIHLGKGDLFAAGGIGARNMVVKDIFDIYSAMKGVQNVFGDEQQVWIDEKLTSSSSWRLFASPVSLAPMVVDLSGFDTLPEEVRTMFYINVDQFDGFLLKRQEMLEKLRSNRSVILSGDIHSTFVTDHHGVAEFTGSSVSSATFSETLNGKLRRSDLVSGIEGLVEVIESLDLDAFLISSNQTLVEADGEFSVLKAVDTVHHGYMIVDVEQDSITASAYLIDPVYVSQKLYNAPDLNERFVEKTFTVASDGRLV